MDDTREPDVFSVRVNAKHKIDFKDPLKDRSLRFWPWPYIITPYGKKSGFKTFTDHCNNSEDYNTLGAKERTEALRLLYVGFTRARDYLIIPFKTDKQECWLKPIVDKGIASFIDLDEIATGEIIEKSKLINQPLRLWVTVYNDYAEEIDSTHKNAEVYRQKIKKDYLPYYVTPSGSQPVEVTCPKIG